MAPYVFHLVCSCFLSSGCMRETFLWECEIVFAWWICCIHLELKLEETELTNEEKICVSQLTFCVWALSPDVKATGMSLRNASAGGPGDNCRGFLSKRKWYLCTLKHRFLFLSKSGWKIICLRGSETGQWKYLAFPQKKCILKVRNWNHRIKEKTLQELSTL